MIDYEVTAQDESRIRDTIIQQHERAVFMARPSVMLGLKPFPDGDSWCVLYGEDIQSGVAGFGDTPDDAMHDFDKAWRE